MHSDTPSERALEEEEKKPSARRDGGGGWGGGTPAEILMADRWR